MYRTKQVCIKKGHKLYAYCHELCENTAHLYNRANYIVRQYVTGRQAIAEGKSLFDNQKDVLKLVDQYLTGTKYMPKGDWFTYGSMDYLLKVAKDADYYALPAHVNQHILKQLFEDYKSFFESVKSYSENPASFTGRPKMPGYKKGESTALLSNQVCVIKNGRYMKLPKTKALVNLGPVSGTLKSAHIVKKLDAYIIEAVIEIPDTGISDADNILPDTVGRVMSIDPGVNNLCAVTGTAGFQPFLINGRIVKSINQWYNKELARLKSAAELCNGVKTTKRIRALTNKRNRRMRDAMHKVSRYLTDFAVAHGVDTVVFGHNVRWKTECRMRIATQGFVQMPFDQLCNMLRYKLNAVGIRFIEAEESYTSKADYLALDYIPTYGKENGTPYFSGVRFKRGLYRHYNGQVSNADINGAANILRKVFPNAQPELWDRGLMNSPKLVNIA